MADTIADMLAQIANANHKFKENIELPSSKFKVELARVLKEEGFINHYRTISDRKQGRLKITLKYSPNKERAIQGVKRVSRSGLRVFKGWDEIPSVQNGLGTAVVSTSKGLMSSKKAKENRLGGEVIAKIW